MVGTILQVNIGKGGVPKYPVPEARVTPAGLDGDAVAHPNIHGGPRQAVLLIASEIFDELAPLGYKLGPGSLGENVTMRGIDRRRLRIGQRYRLGPEVIVELTKIRTPCNTIRVYGDNIKNDIFDAQVKAGDFTSPRWGMSGMYASVVVAGMMRPGDPIILMAESA
jgi:MOSC domain-containing protein YiiM